MSEPELSEKIASYIQNRATARSEKLEKDAEKQRKESDEGSLESAQKRAEHEASFKPASWLTDAATRAKQINVVTHALKFTHSDAKGSSIYLHKVGDGPEEPRYLSTSTLSDIKADVVGNAAALDVAGLLRLEDGERVSLINRIAQGDTSSLAPFAENDDQLAEWVSGFKAVLTDKELSSHQLAKQLYFPLPDGGYHLLSPLYASSLAQALYQRITDSRYSDDAMALRKARREEKYSVSETVDYLAVAVQNFGGTKPQNVSQLNSGRGGKSFLMSCQPPVWRKQDKPPSSGNAFWREFDRRAWKTAKELKDYLTSIKDRSSTKARRDVRADLVDELMDTLFFYASEIIGMTDQVGWSAHSALPLSEQLWLDPLRDDEEFQRKRESDDWQTEIAERFASWLNRKLESDKLAMKDAEYREWLGLVETKFKQDLEGFAS
jgi:CRISPR-associated protein Csy1